MKRRPVILPAPRLPQNAIVRDGLVLGATPVGGAGFPSSCHLCCLRRGCHMECTVFLPSHVIFKRHDLFPLINKLPQKHTRNDEIRLSDVTDVTASGTDGLGI